MITKQFIGVMIAAIITIMSNKINAQENDSSMKSKAQVTFAYPLGSNGMNSKDYSNNYSLNILYGLNGGVDGVEIGGYVNYNDGDVNGVQIAGVLNLNKKQSRGLILAGTTNICSDSSSGVLISGVLNLSKNKSKGLQLSTVNVVESEFSGFQLGVVNYAEKVKGIQLGVVNLSDDGEEGLPIGLINVVKNGHYEFEVTTGDALFANINYKMGVKKFYTIFKLGFSSYKGNPVYSCGIGFGSMISFTEKHKMNIDLSTNTIVYDNNWNNSWDGERNVLNKLDFSYKYSISKHLSLMAGPSFNVYTSQIKVDDTFGTLNTPYTIYTKERTNSKLFMWIGFNAGLAFNL